MRVWLRDGDHELKTSSILPPLLFLLQDLCMLCPLLLPPSHSPLYPAILPPSNLSTPPTSPIPLLPVPSHYQMLKILYLSTSYRFSLLFSNHTMFQFYFSYIHNPLTFQQQPLCNRNQVIVLKILQASKCVYIIHLFVLPMREIE